MRRATLSLCASLLAVTLGQSAAMEMLPDESASRVVGGPDAGNCCVSQPYCCTSGAVPSEEECEAYYNCFSTFNACENDPLFEGWECCVARLQCAEYSTNCEFDPEWGFCVCEDPWQPYFQVGCDRMRIDPQPPCGELAT